jgi:hypothetical protein
MVTQQSTIGNDPASWNNLEEPMPPFSDTRGRVQTNLDGSNRASSHRIMFRRLRGGKSRGKSCCTTCHLARRVRQLLVHRPGYVPKFMARVLARRALLRPAMGDAADHSDSVWIRTSAGHSQWPCLSVPPGPGVWFPGRRAAARGCQARCDTGSRDWDGPSVRVGPREGGGAVASSGGAGGVCRWRRECQWRGAARQCARGDVNEHSL